MIFLVAAFLLFLVGGLAAAYWLGKDDRASGVVVGGAVVLIALMLAGVASLPGQAIPDGCYRITTSHGSGVGVGVSGRGNVTVVPIVTSDRTYTPIGCPG